MINSPCEGAPHLAQMCGAGVASAATATLMGSAKWHALRRRWRAPMSLTLWSDGISPRPACGWR